MAKKPILTEDEDAALYAELQPEMPKVEAAVAKINREMEMLSDIGQVAAVVEVAFDFILRHVNRQDDALALSEHVRSQVDIGIKAYFSRHEAPDAQQ